MMAGAAALCVMLAIAAAIAHFGPNAFEMKHRWKPTVACGITVLFILCLIRIYGSTNSPFLYFQF